MRSRLHDAQLCIYPEGSFPVALEPRVIARLGAEPEVVRDGDHGGGTVVSRVRTTLRPFCRVWYYSGTRNAATLDLPWGRVKRGHDVMLTPGCQ